MSVVPLSEILDDRTILFPITVEQYHQMMEMGIVEEGEPFELLEGYLVRKDRSTAGEDPMTVGHEHALVVKRLARLSATAVEPHGSHLQTQQPIVLPARSEPEPDAAILLGDVERYADRLPGAAEVLCVIEVADASLMRDRKLKQRIYARAGIPLYIIINLIDRVAEVHTAPDAASERYAKSQVVPANEEIALPVAADETIRVPLSQLLR